MEKATLVSVIAELQKISPMPTDEDLENWPSTTEDPLNLYVEVIQSIKQRVISDYPLEVIRPLLLSFGLGDGFGAYWSTLHLIEAFPDENAAYSIIREECASVFPGTRKWCALLLARRRNREDLPFLVKLLSDETEQVREQAILGIMMLAESYDISEVIPNLDKLIREDIPSIRSLAQEIKDTLNNK